MTVRRRTCATRAAHASPRSGRTTSNQKRVSQKAKVKFDPGYLSSYVYLALAHLAKGELPQAIEFAEKAASMAHHPHWTAHVGWMYGLAGRRDDAARILADPTELAHRTYVSPFSFSAVYLGMADMENWRSMMQACVDERNSMLPYLDAPWNDSVRNDPFFAEVRRKVGLPAPRDTPLQSL